MPYTAPTLTQAQTALSNRLNDQSTVRWVTAELTVYLQEALRTWNAWTQFYRAQESFVTTPLQTYYDLPTVCPTTRAYTVTNWDLVTSLQYALLEPAAAGGTWTGTDQFDLAQLSTAIQRRRDQFLRDTGAILTQSSTLYAAPPASGRIALDEAVDIVRSCGWRVSATQTLLPLIRTDEWAANNFQPLWVTSPRPPYAYSVSTVPPLTLQVIPPPAAAGTLELLSISRGATISTGVATLLGIPDDFSWVIKYGALADLLQGDGLALDPQRAAYCQQRWDQGIDQARRASVTLAAQLNDLPVPIVSQSDADSYSPTWAMLAGNPLRVVLAGQNLVATWPPPFAITTVTLDVVANMPVPVNPADVLQISADVYDSILDLAQHLALFKEGAGQVELASALLNRAAAAAGIATRFQQAMQPSRAPLLGQQQQDRRSSPEQLADVVAIPVED